MERSYGFCFTWFNYDESTEDLLASLDCVYLVYGHEVAPSTGNSHLQGYVHFKSQRTVRSIIKKFPGANIIAAKGSAEENFKYCSKDAVDVVERGVRPKSKKQQGLDEQARWDFMRRAAESGDFHLIPSKPYAQYCRNFAFIHNQFVESKHFEDNDVLENYWYFGPSGSGKSSTARKDYPGAYLKMKNKWWNGYKDQEVVIIDDISPNHKAWIGDFLKEWSDHYPFQAEVKNGCRVIRPKIVVVTSQYSIEECFAGTDAETIDALRRRFRVRTFCGPEHSGRICTHVSACNYP